MLTFKIQKFQFYLSRLHADITDFPPMSAANALNLLVINKLEFVYECDTFNYKCIPDDQSAGLSSKPKIRERHLLVRGAQNLNGVRGVIS